LSLIKDYTDFVIFTPLYCKLNAVTNAIIIKIFINNILMN